MPWQGPSYRGEFPSLGWEISEWITDNLFVPDGPHMGEPLVLTDEQLQILVRFYRLNPRTGAPVYRRAAVVRPKGWGKSPFLAAIALAEACGPVRFVEWDDDGEPVGAPPPTPLIQIAAVSEDQTDNTYRALYAMVGATTEVDGVTVHAPIVGRYNLDVGLTRIYIPGGGIIEPVTASSGTRQGQRVTFSVFDETHLWLPSNHGDTLAETIRGNVGKMSGRTFESTNAWVPGEESVAEKTAEAARAPGVLFDHRKNPTKVSLTNKRELRRGLSYVYGESGARGGWIDLSRIMAEIADPACTDEYAYRFYLNDETVRSDAWVDPRQWEALGTATRPPAGEEITAGFSGLAYQGAALVGCHVGTGDLFTIATWETAGAEMVSRTEVTAEVTAMMEGFLVRRFYVNPQEWASEYDAWHLIWGDMVVIAPPQQVARTAVAVDRFRTAVSAGEFHHDANPVLTRHVERARSRQVAAGRLILPRTDAPTEQITAARAAVLAHEARAAVLAEPVEEEPDPWFAFA